MKRSRENPSPISSDVSEGEAEADQKAGFIGRWSRRKRNAAVEAGLPLAEEFPVAEGLQEGSDHTGVVEQQLLETPADESTPASDLDSAPAPILTDADMPDVETLNAESDFSPFLSKGVSKELRNLALKKLFFSGKFSARDGLDDYDDDFTKFEPLGDTVTSDMKFHARRKEKARLAELEEERLRLESEHAESDEEVPTSDTTDNVSVSEGESSEVEVTSNDELQDSTQVAPDKSSELVESPEVENVDISITDNITTENNANRNEPHNV